MTLPSAIFGGGSEEFQGPFSRKDLPQRPAKTKAKMKGGRAERWGGVARMGWRIKQKVWGARRLMERMPVTSAAGVLSLARPRREVINKYFAEAPL